MVSVWSAVLLVAHARDGKVLRRYLRTAALETDDRHAGFGELLAQDAAGPASADQHDIYFLHCFHCASV
jgi:hypothetical protein